MTKLAIIGPGTMGQYTARALSPKVESIFVYEPQGSAEDKLQDLPVNFQSSYRDAVKDCDVVIFCVPTHAVQEVMAKTLPYCKAGTLISGQTSRKTPEAEAFDLNGKGLECVTIHTMCNPDKSDPSKEILGIIRHRASDAGYDRAVQLYGDMSEHVEYFDSVEEHDTRTANTQINTSFTFLSIASAFAQRGCFPWLNESYRGPLDVMKFSLAMRAASLSPHVYRGIQFGSSHGKKIVTDALSIEYELFRLIIGDERKEYHDRVLAAKKKLFGEDRDPILSEETMEEFDQASMPNSHFSIIQYAVAFAESGRDPFSDLKATTPMYTSLLCLMDYLFNSDGLLEATLAAPFDIPELRADDLVFHDQISSWSNGLLFDHQPTYEAHHERMRSRLEDSVLTEQVRKSQDIVRICRESMATFVD